MFVMQVCVAAVQDVHRSAGCAARTTVCSGHLFAALARSTRRSQGSASSCSSGVHGSATEHWFASTRLVAEGALPARGETPKRKVEPMGRAREHSLPAALPRPEKRRTTFLPTRLTSRPPRKTDMTFSKVQMKTKSQNVWNCGVQALFVTRLFHATEREHAEKP